LGAVLIVDEDRDGVSDPKCSTYSCTDARVSVA
jgi:hypothetical protein